MPESILRRRATPAGQEIGVLALGKLHGAFERMVEIVFNHLAFDAPPKGVGPEKFAERRRILREAAGAAQFARQRAEWIVDQVAHRFGNVLVIPPLAAIVVWMHPAAVIQDK